MPPLYTEVDTNVIPSAVGVSPTQAVTVVEYNSATDGITATVSGTQATSLLLVSKANRVTTVTTAGDSVRLPPALAGASMTISNASANALGVFPSSAAQGGVSGGDKINALAQNAVFSQVTGRVSYFCYTVGVWQTA